MDSEQLEFDFYYYGENAEKVNGKLNITEDAFDPPKDDVSRPAHYTMGNIEVFDFIKAWDLSFAEGNVVKYVVRAPYKGSHLKDLKKARWYLDQLIAQAESNEL